MSDQIKLASVRRDAERYVVRLAWPDDSQGLTAGTWAGTGPKWNYGMVVGAPRPELLRQMAAGLIEAADRIDRIETKGAA